MVEFLRSRKNQRERRAQRPYSAYLRRCFTPDAGRVDGSAMVESGGVTALEEYLSLRQYL